jgi:Uma2 family endonuclease
MATIETITTADQLLTTPGLGRCELVRGELMVMSPAGFEHGQIIGEMTAALVAFVKQHQLGMVMGAETGFQIGHNPDTVRAPDVAFVRSDRVPPAPVRGFFQGPPDLAVEVVSPGDRVGEVAAKVQQWLDAGCSLVWVVDPQVRTVAVYRSRGSTGVVGAAGELSGEDVLPGFRLALADLFTWPTAG